MKKLTKVLILSAVIIVLSVIHVATSKHHFNSTNLWYIGMTLFIAIGVPVIVWIEMKRNKQGKPMVDELSKKVALKSYAKSYYLSFISWGLVLGLSEYLKFNNRIFFLIDTLYF